MREDGAGMTRERKTPKMCGRTGGNSLPDRDGDVHVHVCTLNEDHPGRHQCEYCPHTW